MLLTTVAGVFLLALMSPGPDFIMCVRNAVKYSRRAGIYTAIGFSLGVAVHITYAHTGLALLISESILLFNLVKLLGAAYLIFIGLSSFFGRSDSDTEVSPAKTEVDISPLKAVRIGFLTNLLNPKAPLIFISLFTFVITPETDVFVTGLVSLVMVAETVIWFSLVAIFMTQRGVRNVYQRFQGMIQKVFGGLLVAMGIKVALLRN